jgi:Flp pilus assembly protein TadG
MRGLAVLWRQARVRGRATLAGWRDREDGVTALEFAIVAPWFLMLLFGIMAVGLFFFTTFTLENAVEQAARLIRTGQAQAAGMTADQFKAKVCENAPQYVDCTNKMRVSVVSGSDAGTLTTPSCLGASGTLAPATSSTYTPGGSGVYVLVTVCYEWEMAAALPFLHLGDMGNGSALIQASTVFKTEPYGS